MDKKKFLDLLKNLQNIMRCPSCGAIYDVQEVQFIGSQDGYFLLSMTCSSCSLPVWVNFFAGGVAPKPVSDLTVSDLHLVKREPITENEVIDFHLFVKGFDGDFKKKLKVKR
jgi:hypothetical protein